MGETVKAKRTQVGGTTGTTIAVSRSVTVILDQPAEADAVFELSGGGRYHQSLRASDAEPLVAGEKRLRFVGVSPKTPYTLSFAQAKGLSRPVFLNIPIDSMTAAGHGPHQSKYTYNPMSVQVPRKLPDQYHADQTPDKDLVQRSPVLVALVVADPKF